MGTCLIPNCRKNTPSSEPFCADHRDVEDRDPTYQKRYEAALRNWDVEVNDLRSKLVSCEATMKRDHDEYQASLERWKDEHQKMACRLEESGKQFDAALSENRDLRLRLDAAEKARASSEEAARAIEKMERIRRLIEDAEDPQVALNAIEDVIAAE